MELKNFNIIILLTFLNSLSVRVQGELDWGIDSQRKKGRDLYNSRLILQSQFLHHKNKLLVRIKIDASQSDKRR